MQHNLQPQAVPFAQPGNSLSGSAVWPNTETHLSVWPNTETHHPSAWPNNNNNTAPAGPSTMYQTTMNSQVEQAFQTRKRLEGPTLLRMLAAAGGLAVVIAGVYSMVHVAQIAHPAESVLKITQIICGLMIIATEMKDLKFLVKIRDFSYKWMPFLTVMLGKGAFYIFTGSLAASFYENLTLFIPAMAVLAIGVIYVGMYFGHFQSFSEQYHQANPATTTFMLNSDENRNYNTISHDNNIPMHHGGNTFKQNKPEALGYAAVYSH